MNDDDAPGMAQETRSTCGMGDDTLIVFRVRDLAYYLALIGVTATISILIVYLLKTM